jgi:MFS family permease
MSVLRPRLATTGLFLANGFGIGNWAASIAPIKAALGLSDAELGIALLAFAIGALSTMTVTGHLAAHFGSARIAFLGSLAFAAALPLPALAPNLPTLILAIFALGACNGAMDVAMNGHGTLVERASGRPIMSSLHAAFSLGCLLGSAGAGVLLSFGLGAIAGLGSAGCLTLLLALIGVASLYTIVSAPAEEAPGFVLPNRAILQIGLLAFLAMFTEGAIADWSAVYLVSAAGATAAVATAGFSGFAFAMTIGRLTGDRVVHRLGRPRVLRLGSAIAALGLAIALVAPRVEVAVVGFALAGIGIANIVPVLFSAAGARMGDHPGIGVAMAATCGYTGFLTSPPLIGFAANGFGLRIALILLVIAILTVTLLAGRIRGEPASRDPVLPGAGK